MAYEKMSPPVPKGHVTIIEIVRRLEITHMTFNKWRAGTSERLPVPYKKIPCGLTHRVVISEYDLRLWLNTYRPELLPRWDGSAPKTGKRKVLSH